MDGWIEYTYNSQNDGLLEMLVALNSKTTLTLATFKVRVFVIIIAGCLIYNVLSLSDLQIYIFWIQLVFFHSYLIGLEGALNITVHELMTGAGLLCHDISIKPCRSAATPRP